MINNFKQQAIDLIKASKNILVFAAYPDGDSIASAIALYLSLKKIGKNVTAVSDGYIPDMYKFLPNIDDLKNTLDKLSSDFVVTIDCTNNPVKGVRYTVENNKLNIFITPQNGKISKDLVSFGKGSIDYDLIISVDAPNEDMLGDIFLENKEVFSGIDFINFDHHISNTNFGTLNIVDDKASSTCEILFGVIQSLEENIITSEIATALLTGILFDTRTFQNANTTSKSLTISAQLVSMGAKREEIVSSIYKTKPLAMLKLWGKILSSLNIDKKYKIVWGVITQQDFVDFGLDSKNGNENLIDDILSGVEGTETAILLTEKSAGLITCSVRCKGERDANEFAKIFGGGGHKKASGFKIEGKQVNDVENIVISEARKFFGENKSLDNNSLGEVKNFESKVEDNLEEKRAVLPEKSEELKDISEEVSSKSLDKNTENLAKNNSNESIKEENLVENQTFEQDIVDVNSLEEESENNNNGNKLEELSEKRDSDLSLESSNDLINSKNISLSDLKSPQEKNQDQENSDSFDLDSLLGDKNILENGFDENQQQNNDFSNQKSESLDFESKVFENQQNEDFNLDDILNAFPNPEAEKKDEEKNSSSQSTQNFVSDDVNIDDLLK